ncbi:porin [Candidatus Pelagibacter bacterium]|nr:porin [Candidatus Pelagibacter bacterium]MDA8844683.1 porin [Candidatus Pelagibacter bacterium]
MNIKKIGLTALAASLVSVSAQAGEMSVNGGASMAIKNNSGVDAGKAITMGNQLTFTGGGELDNGLNVSLSFVLDHADNDAQGFDSHSITVSSDALGSITVAGDGAGNAQSALDTTAAGDIWNNGFKAGTTDVAYIAMAGSDASDNSVNYTLPTLVDGLSISASYSSGGLAVDSTTAFGATYTGVEGLSVSYGVGEAGSTTATASGDVTTMKASYAIGSFTAAVSNTESDKDSTGIDEEMDSWQLSYTVSDNLSISYGEETHETSGQTVDEEFDAISVSYTTGGMTITAANYEASGIANATGEAGEANRWKLAASFAF